jgi:DNA-binding NarL/FixJ family response regulator
MTDMNTTRSLPSKSSPPALRIFLVEDSAAVRNLIVENLAQIPGIAWAGFSDTESDALEQLLTQSCDVLIVDIELKQGNGMSLLRKLSQAHAHAQSLKVVFSNNICDAYRRSGQQYGVRHFLDKSYELPQLRVLLEQTRARNSCTLN